MREEQLIAENILERLAEQPEQALTTLYKENKRVCIGYIRKFGGEPQDHLDAYHDAVLAFYNIWLSGKYDPERGKLQTLICAIAKYKLLKRLGKRQKEPLREELHYLEDVIEDHPSENIFEKRIEIVEKALGQIGVKCQEIITLFYYQRCSIQDIVHRLDYKNENVVKAHKSRCMKTLKNIVQKLAHE